MATLLRYLGPDSPLTAPIAGFICALLLILLALILGPPAFWTGAKVFGWWFRFWAL